MYYLESEVSLIFKLLYLTIGDFDYKIVVSSFSLIILNSVYGITCSAHSLKGVKGMPPPKTGTTQYSAKDFQTKIMQSNAFYC